MKKYTLQNPGSLIKKSKNDNNESFNYQKCLEQSLSDPSNYSCQGYPDIWLAVHFNDWNRVQKLKDAGHDINATPTVGEYAGCSAAWVAIFNNNLIQLQKLRDTGADVNSLPTMGYYAG